MGYSIKGGKVVRDQAAQADAGFEKFRAQAKRTFEGMSDRDIGEAWMRGSAWTASGAEAMVIHKPGQTPRRSESDIHVSLRYGALAFEAFISPELLREAIDGWQRGAAEWIANVEKQTGRRHGLREMTRHTILKELIEHNHGRGDTAAMLTGATGWLATTGPAGDVITKFDAKALHYEITDIADSAGRPGHNFRLVLNCDDEPLPDWIQEMPSPFDATANENEGEPSR